MQNRLFQSFIILLSIFVVSNISVADTYKTVRPERVGLSSERLERVDRLIETSIQKQEIAGAVALIARKGQLAHFKAYGLADSEEKIPMRQNTIFRIASMSKAITTVAVMMLYEEGRFAIDDPLHQYIPRFKNMQVLIPHEEGIEPPFHLVPAQKKITIRHLLTHSSGIIYPNNGHLGELYKNNKIGMGLNGGSETIGDMVKRLCKLPLNHHPGTHVDYGLSIDVLGRLVEIWSGKSFDRFLQERIFEPLNMKDTFFHVPAEKRPRFAAIHKQDEEHGLVKIEDEWKGADCPTTYFSGGGGLCSTTYDYYRFCQMMLNQGTLDGHRLLSRKTVELMLHDHLGAMGIDFGMEMKQPGFGFGYGFAIHLDQSLSNKIRSAGSYGWGGYWGTEFWIDPKEELIGIIMTQNQPGGAVEAFNKYDDAVYQTIDD